MYYLSHCTLVVNLSFSIKVKICNKECKSFFKKYQKRECLVMVNEIIDKILVHTPLFIICYQIPFDMKKKPPKSQSGTSAV